jgi:hypothetical protein
MNEMIQTEDANQSDQNQVQRDNKIKQAWHDQNKYAGDQGDEGYQSQGNVHRWI